jgi:hypothetical protein
MRRPKRIALPWSFTNAALLCALVHCASAVAADSFPGGIAFDSPSQLSVDVQPAQASSLPADDPPTASYSTPPPADWFTSDFTSPGRPPVDLLPVCQARPKMGLYGFVGYDSWRGIQDNGWNNDGISTGLNFGTRLGRFSDWTGVGFQLGGSMGVYDWNGTNYHLTHMDQATPQGFVTYGFFRKANQQSNWSGAVVQDWMLNSNFGIFAQNPTLAQWRGQLGYAVGSWSEIGVWGTWRGQGDTRVVPGFGATAWRPVEQLNPYVHSKWGQGGADTWLWFGVPEHDRLAGRGSLGDYLVGARADCPLSDRVMLYTLVTYMHPSAGPGPAGSTEEAWNFTIGLSFFPAGNARTSTVAGQCWMPQLPVANNGYFLVDTNRTF